MGGPSAAIVCEELISLGVERAVRVGTAGGLGSLALGTLLVAGEAFAMDGTSRALGAGERVAGDLGLTAALRHAVPDAACGAVVTSDLFYEGERPRFDEWRRLGALGVEMEAAALFAVGQARGAAIGCVVAITDLLGQERERIGAEALAAAGLAVGRAGMAALIAQ
jgi:uridine phosphorylase